MGVPPRGGAIASTMWKGRGWPGAGLAHGLPAPHPCTCHLASHLTPWPSLGVQRATAVLGEVAKVETRDAWDGGDGQEVVEEEFDLADLMAEEEEGDGAGEL